MVQEVLCHGEGVVEGGREAATHWSSWTLAKNPRRPSRRAAAGASLSLPRHKETRSNTRTPAKKLPCWIQRVLNANNSTQPSTLVVVDDDGSWAYMLKVDI